MPKNVKGGTFCDFLTSIVLQNIETNEGGPSDAIQKTSKKSRKVPKKSGAKVGFLDVCIVFLFVLDALLRLDLLGFEVVEV